MKLSDALNASALNAAINSTGRQPTMVRRHGDTSADSLESFAQRPDTREWEHAPINHAAYVSVDVEAWQPMATWPNGMQPEN